MGSAKVILLGSAKVILKGVVVLEALLEEALMRERTEMDRLVEMVRLSRMGVKVRDSLGSL